LAGSRGLALWLEVAVEHLVAAVADAATAEHSGTAAAVLVEAPATPLAGPLATLQHVGAPRVHHAVPTRGLRHRGGRPLQCAVELHGATRRGGRAGAEEN